MAPRNHPTAIPLADWTISALAPNSSGTLALTAGTIGGVGQANNIAVTPTVLAGVAFLAVFGVAVVAATGAVVTAWRTPSRAA